MYEKIEECPICGSPHFQNHVITHDHMVTQESFLIVQCDHCDFLFTNPRPTSKDIGKYYKSDQYISHTNKSNSLINLAYKLVRNYTLHKKAKLLTQYSFNNKVLDYGAGTGDLLGKLSKKGWQSFGVEPDPDAREIAKTRQIDVKENLEQLEENEFGIITLWHVLEHIHDLNKTFIELKSKLHKKGTIIIAVPNYESKDAEIYGEHWAAWDTPRHLYHFSQKTMKRFIRKHKMKLIEILPMKFDAYYVSLLSEKYKNHSNQILNALRNGMKSNTNAKITSNYSSLIYIIKNK